MHEINMNNHKGPFSSDNTLLMGEARTTMGQDVLNSVVQLIERNQSKSVPYYILVTSRQDPTNEMVLRTKLVMMSKRPIEMLGSICFRVDNRKSKVARLWVLPLDRPRQLIVPASGELVPAIAQAARRMPIIHG